MENYDKSIPFLVSFKKYYDERYDDFSKLHNTDSEKIEVVESFLREIVEKSDFSMCVKTSSLQQIINDDRFKNQVETLKGSSMGGVKGRKETTHELFGVDTEKLAPNEFPKYGLLTSKNKLADLAVNPDVFYHYGSLMVTFKKQNLINRTTMTVGTSLDFGESFNKTPTFVSNPKALCVKGFPSKNIPQLFNNFFGGINGLTLFYEKIISKQITTDFPNRMSDAFDGMLGFEFFELQFHGNISFSNDVEKIEYYPLFGNEKETLETVEPYLKKYGISYESMMPSYL